MNLRKSILRLSLPVFLISGILLAGCSQISGLVAADPTTTPAPVTQGDNQVIVEGRVTPRDSTSLFFTASGKITEVLVKEGDQVKAGDVLARLGDRETYQANVASANLELANAQQALKDLKDNADLAYSQTLLDVTAAQQALVDARKKLNDIDTENYQNQIDQAKADVADTEKKLQDAQDEFDKYKDLDTDNPSRRNAKTALDAAQDRYDEAVRKRDLLVNDLDEAKAEVSMAQASLNDAQRRRDNRQNGPDPDQLALAQARVDNAQAQLAAANAALTHLELTAPFNGTVTKIDVAVGEQAVPNQPVMVLADFSSWYVDTNDLTENEVVYLQLNQSASVVPDALPDLTMTGQVESIADSYVEKSGDITYQVRILLNDPDPRLRWGMTVEVRMDRKNP
jgi:multidrug resistance efflux pump